MFWYESHTCGGFFYTYGVNVYCTFSSKVMFDMYLLHFVVENHTFLYLSL